jgi:hypothetical protein
MGNTQGTDDCEEVEDQVEKASRYRGKTAIQAFDKAKDSLQAQIAAYLSEGEKIRTAVNDMTASLVSSFPDLILTVGTERFPYTLRRVRCDLPFKSRFV